MKAMNRVRIAVIAIALLVVVAAPVAFAQSGDDGGQGRSWRGHRGHMGGMLFGELNLSDAQKAQMKQIHESHSQTLEPIGQEIRTKRGELRQLSEGSSFDETLVRQKLTEIAGLEAKVMAERHAMFQEALNVLTPEQRTQLEQKRAEMKSKWSERRGHKGQGQNQ